MDRNEIERINNVQKSFYESGKTFSYESRIEKLDRLYSSIEKYSEKLKKALKIDLCKAEQESEMCEIGLTLSEITYVKKHLKKWMKKKKVHTPLSQFASSSFIRPLPYGNVLIMSPWNYPVLLTLEPLCDALAGGNTVILKPSQYSKETTTVLKEMIEETFREEEVALIEGGREENSALLDINFDYIFFTGSKEVGKIVMAKASEHLTPVTLELGGKSPVFVTENASIELACKRIVFGKLINAGQTCVAPDYILVDEKIKDELQNALINEIRNQVGSDALQNSEYGKIINEKHFKRILGLINSDKIVYGGRSDEKTLKIEPTVLANVNEDDSIMKEEIFGPIFPIISYKTLDDAIKYVKKNEHPLALYVFTNKRKEADYIMKNTLFGGGCINDTLVHLATSSMGFGGVRESGIGSYHGKNGFDTFSHYTSILDKKRFIDLPMRYRPYSDKKRKLIKIFLK